MFDYDSPLARSIRESIALACRFMIDRELKPSHLSMRVPGTELFFVRARGGGTSAAEVVLVDMAGSRLAGSGDPPLELPLHTEILRRRSDISAVLHTHQPYAVRFGERAACDPSNAVPIYPSSDQIATTERGDEVARLLGSDSTIHLQGHGMAFAGTNIEEVVNLAIALEDHAKRSA